MTDNQISRNKWIWLAIFSLAMAYLEAAVVVYLRELYYPQGFRFPLNEIPLPIYLVEIGREAATIAMLLGIAFVAAKSFWNRFAAFIFCFGLWDLGYYLWLKVFLGWPASLLDYDILFLIPVPWTAPVLAPVIVSVCLVAAAVAIRNLPGLPPRPPAAAWLLSAVGAGLVLASFLAGAGKAIHREMPGPFHWEIFGLGLILAWSAFPATVKKGTGQGEAG